MSHSTFKITTHREYERDYLFNEAYLEEFEKWADRVDICLQWQLDAWQNIASVVSRKFSEIIDCIVSWLKKEDIENKQEFPHPLIWELQRIKSLVTDILLNTDTNENQPCKLRVQQVKQSDNNQEWYLTIKFPIESEAPTKYKSNIEKNIEISPELARILIPAITPANNRWSKKNNHWVRKRRIHNWPWRVSEFIYPSWPQKKRVYTIEVEVEDTNIIHDMPKWVWPEITFDNTRFWFLWQANLQIMNSISEKKYKLYESSLRMNSWTTMLGSLMNIVIGKKPTPPSASSSHSLPPLG